MRRTLAWLLCGAGWTPLCCDDDSSCLIPFVSLISWPERPLLCACLTPPHCSLGRTVAACALQRPMMQTHTRNSARMSGTQHARCSERWIDVTAGQRNRSRPTCSLNPPNHLPAVQLNG